ncbi:hypothetical protein CHS0354_035650, partial [Potamilus streckersoni]
MPIKSINLPQQLILHRSVSAKEVQEIDGIKSTMLYQTWNALVSENLYGLVRKKMEV